jgi:hypothetical protein
MRALTNSEPRLKRQECPLKQHPLQSARMRLIEPTGQAIMKPSIDLIKNIYTQVIRHNLSQPEEIDHVLMTMAAEDLAANTAIASAMKLIEAARDTAHGSFPTVDGFSYGVTHRKSSYCQPDHYLFFASRAY